MRMQVMPTAAAVAALLAACAGAPGSHAVRAPAPWAEGAYRFSGFVPGPGAVDGVIHFDAAGTATVAVSVGAAKCQSTPQEHDGRLHAGCGGVGIRVAHDADSPAPQVTLSGREREVVEKPALPFECRGDGAAGRDRSFPGCTVNGMTRTTSTRSYRVAARVSRVP